MRVSCASRGGSVLVRRAACTRLAGEEPLRRCMPPRRQGCLPVVPTLRGEDGVDGTTVSFFLSLAMEMKKQDEGEGGGEGAGEEGE